MGKNDTLIRISLYAACIILVIILNLVYLKMAKNIMDETVKGKYDSNNEKQKNNNANNLHSTIQPVPTQVLKTEQFHDFADRKRLLSFITSDLAGIKVLDTDNLDSANSVDSVDDESSDDERPKVETPKIEGNGVNSTDKNVSAIIKEYYKNKWEKYWANSNKSIHNTIQKINQTVGEIISEMDFKQKLLM